MSPGITPPLQPIRPAYHLRILDDTQLSQLKSTTLRILNEIGIHCPSQQALKIYAEHGASGFQGTDRADPT